MAILELVRDHPDWPGALGVALTRPPGTPERRGGQDHWKPDTSGRPRRISDDLAWFRDAVDEPELHELHTLADTAAVAAWRASDEAAGRLSRLRDRGILDAAGFLLHADDGEDM
jgi:hypothetical protein